MKIAAAWKAAEEAAIDYALSLIDIAEQEHSISKVEAVEQRIELHRKMIGIQEEYLGKIDKLKDPAGWYAQQTAIVKTREELLKLNKALKEQTGTFTQGVDEGFKQYLDTLRTRFQEGVYIAQQAAQAMEQAFSDFFFDAMTGKLKSLWDYIKSFLMSVARAIANIMAQQAAAGFVGSFMAPSAPAGDGTVSFHKGGYVPRFHVGGLMSDERPAILQTGEGVLSRKGMAALDELNNGKAGSGGVMVTVNNYTGTPIEAENTGVQFDGENFVVNVVLKNLEGYGPLHHAINGAVRR
jgi:hypothetical protein